MFARLHDKQMSWVKNLASVRIIICFVAFFPLCYSGEVLEGTILTEVCIIH